MSVQYACPEKFISKLCSSNYFVSGKVKSERYWPPDKEPITLGGVTIQLLHEESKKDWTIRKFNVTKVRFATSLLQTFTFVF